MWRPGVGASWLAKSADFDLVIVEDRAEDVQQLVILGHELWHLHAGHRFALARVEVAGPGDGPADAPYCRVPGAGA